MKQMIVVIVLLMLSITPCQARAGEANVKLSIKQDDEREVVLIGDDLFTAYHYKDTQKPYLYPIIGPTGAKMTRDYPMKAGVKGEDTDHPHHTSLWFAHGDVNGIDFWHKAKGYGIARHDSAVIPRKPADRAIIATTSTWLEGGEHAIAHADTDFVFQVLDDQSRVIDCRKAITPALHRKELAFGDTKEGTMAIRLAPQLRLKGKVATGQAINSEGHKDKDVWGKRAKWVAYWGVIDGKTCGVAIFDHPTNLRHPTWWHARDYGLVAANPFGISDFEKKPKGTGDFALKQGETLELQYRFVFFVGTAEEADIAGKYDQWVEETTPKEDK